MKPLKRTSAAARDVRDGANERINLIVNAVGPARRVLLIGNASGPLPEHLDSQGVDVTGVVFDETSAAEATVCCSLVEVVSPAADELPAALTGSVFDVVLFDGSMQVVANPAQLMIDARRLLGGDGYVICAIPNVNFGAIRLALFQGVPSVRDRHLAEYMRAFTAQEASDLFVRAGYRVQNVSFVRLPIFSDHPALPNLKQSEIRGCDRARDRS